VGGGRRQSLLYWKAGQLFQLSVSYLTAGAGWPNSPDIGRHRALRGAMDACTLCHSGIRDARRPPDGFRPYD
jgi:hypothetical protein